MLSFDVKFVLADRHTDNGKTLCPQSFNVGAKKDKLYKFFEGIA